MLTQRCYRHITLGLCRPLREGLILETNFTSKTPIKILFFWIFVNKWVYRRFEISKFYSYMNESNVWGFHTIVRYLSIIHLYKNRLELKWCHIFSRIHNHLLYEPAPRIAFYYSGVRSLRSSKNFKCAHAQHIFTVYKTYRYRD